MSLAMTWRICQLISKNSWHPSSISFTFSVPPDRRFYERFFQVPVRFNSDFNGIVFQSDDLKLALNGSDAYLHEEIKFQLSRLKGEETADFLDEVKRVILKNLELGVCSMDETVKFFLFQRRTFQARLKRLGGEISRASG